MTLPQWILDIEARAAAATPGPWIPKHLKTMYLAGALDGEHEVRSPTSVVAAIAVPPDSSLADADCQFIAHAREDIPRLVEEVRRLTEQVASLKDSPRDL